MKTITLLTSFLCLVVSVNAQNVDRTFLKAGFHGALPLADAADISDFSLGVDVYQHWGITKNLDLGLATGFTNAFTKEEYEDGGVTVQSEFDNVQFIPVAGFFRFYPSLIFSVGCDVGYAFGINEGNEGGLYYRPTVSIDVGRNAGLYFSYTGIDNDGSTWATVTGGVLFLF